jgi:hypothetical protein
VDVVWHEKQERVREVIKDIIEESGGTRELTHEDIFKFRTAAASKVYQSLSEDEKAAIQKKIDEKGDVIPNEVKQQ